MGVQNLSKQALLVTLPREPQSGNELDFARQFINANGDRHVIVDFSLVKIMPSATLCSLIILERGLSTVGRQLVLCSVSPDILGIFRRVGLQSLFRFADDKFAALQSLRRNAWSYG